MPRLAGGTTMLDLADNAFYWLGFSWYLLLVFLVSCTGFALAMLVDFLLVRAVKRLPTACLNNSKLNFLDKILILSEPDRCCETNLKDGTSKSETKNCDGMPGHIRFLILYRATLFVDCLAVCIIYGMLSMLYIGDTTTKSMSSPKAAMYASIYMYTFIFMVRRSFPITSVGSGFLTLTFAAMGPAALLIGIVLCNNESILMEAANVWGYALHFGFSLGVMVHLHLLADGGYKLERSVADTRFANFHAMTFVAGAIALVKVMEVYGWPYIYGEK